MLLAWCAAAVGSTAVSAQTAPWQVFEDGETSTKCSLINADNLELIVLDATGQLVITSSLSNDLTDTTLVDSLVDVNGNVYIGGAPAGAIRFAEDANGTIGLWWVSSLTDHVVRFDTVNNMPFETDGFAGDGVGDVCDPCTVWDDQSICTTPDDGGTVPIITINFCGTNSAATMILTVTGLVGMGIARRPQRRLRKRATPATS